MSEKDNDAPESDTIEIIGSPRRRERLVELMRREIDFSEEAIVRFAKTRLQIDADY